MNLRILLYLILCGSLCVNSAIASSRCSLSGSENPKYNSSINPKYNSSINPKYNSSINPKYNSSINPKYNSSINPKYSSTVTYLLCDQQQNLLGSAIYASDGTVVLFQNNDWIGYTSTNGSGGFNFFDLDGEWEGYFVRTETGKYVGFDIDGNWMFTLTR